MDAFEQHFWRVDRMQPATHLESQAQAFSPLMDQMAISSRLSFQYILENI